MKFSNDDLSEMENPARYIISYSESAEFNASTKARQDVETIAKNEGYIPIQFRGGKTAEGRLRDVILTFFRSVSNWFSLLRKAKKDSIVLVQYPVFPLKTAYLLYFVLPFFRKIHGLHFVALVHDLNSLRGMYGKTAVYQDKNVLPLYDVIICHNDRMKEELIRWGIPAEKLITLGLFDYLTDAEIRDRKKDEGIVVAGNLDPQKCGYLTELIRLAEENNFPLHLYGNGLPEAETLRSTVYEGTYPPEELPGKLKGAFGLVWDGPDGDTCSGPKGNYLRWNNPHKLSLYLAAGIPVLIWREAALADWVEREQVGFSISHLQDIGFIEQSISNSEYCSMKINVSKYKKQLRFGAFSRDAISKSIHLGKENAAIGANGCLAKK